MKLLQSNHFECYNDFFEEWKNEDFTDSGEGPGHYLPYRGVFKKESPTKVRPVFDASCMPRGNLSLNDCLMKGLTQFTRVDTFSTNEVSGENICLQKANSNLRFNLNLPDYDEEEEEDFDRVKDSLASIRTPT
ncbi:hypothetical protein TNIN_495441 [Trichonephila inaurata madagascariensis]|uniref:Uncharacterized protein n=1 Tax=Trichonephila inaurata madagascariensis TaxID=2747483 RepID=A0A8X6Y1X0_9ARAC|nr:hypothetical protein TNIN_495441 [Trichonephila inaurata madagascariensis]